MRRSTSTDTVARLPGKLPVPRLTATIAPPVSKGSFGVVSVLGYEPVRSDYDPPPERAPRKPSRCSICDVTGHARTNRKFHPRGR